ncbi:6606_t:CDS:2 [Dentiscutata heterogama]|uniref:6606_t:CDS:1 n=1 Tax=Dentiscutata heterogama TaxID=1316150 RepID=A0ACA9PC86_9GLOM|nr:6606_t:CDS:2 [Dentiscutata heterogama]
MLEWNKVKAPILLAPGSQDSFSYPTQQNYTLPKPNVLISNNVENLTIDYDISNMNEHQNVEFNSQEKLEIVPDLFDGATHRRCRYACKNQGIGHSKKTAIIENQKQSQT